MVSATRLGGRATGPERLRLVVLFALLAPFRWAAAKSDAASFADGACPESLDGPGSGGDMPVEPEQQLNQKWGAFSWGADVGSGRVCTAVLLRNAAHLLPDFLAGIESQDYPRDLIGLRFYTDGNFDGTGAALEEAKPGLLEKGYESVDIWRGRDLHQNYDGKYADGTWFEERDDCSVAPHCFDSRRMQHMMWLRNMALTDCRKTDAEFYFSLDADVMLTNPQALSAIIREARFRGGIVAPLIHSVEAPKSANFWGAVSSKGFYEHSDEYDDIVLYRRRGTHPVPLVNSAYVMHLPSVDSDSPASGNCSGAAAQDNDDKPTKLLSYSPVEDGSAPPIYDDIISFGANARARSVPQFVTNEQVFGFMAHFVGAEKKSHKDDVWAWERFRNDVLSANNPESEFLLRHILPESFLYLHQHHVDDDVRDLAIYKQRNQKDLTGNQRALQQILNLLEHSKSASDVIHFGTPYEGGYQTIDIDNISLPGQRSPKERLQNVPFNFSNASVLDLGCNQGGMLFEISDEIRHGVGVDHDSRLINVANKIRAHKKARLDFYTFDLEKENLEMVKDFMPEERVDIVFLLSVCMWIQNCKEVIDMVSTISNALLFESNGSRQQQTEQMMYVRSRYKNVVLLKRSSDDNVKNRKLYMCEN